MKQNIDSNPALLFLPVLNNEREINFMADLFLQADLKKAAIPNDEARAKCKVVGLAQRQIEQNKGSVERFVEEVNSLPKGQYQHVTIMTHGGAQTIEIDGVEKENRFDENEGHYPINLTSLASLGNPHPILGPTVIDQIKYLKREKGITNFHINSCHGGALVHDLNRARNDEDLKGVNVNIYSSSKYAVSDELISFIGKGLMEIPNFSDDELTYQNSLESIAANRLKHASETIIFCSNSEQGEMSATKLRNPKASPQHEGFSKAKLRENQLQAFDNGDALLNYFENSALVPVYLNAVGADGERVALPENIAAKTIVKKVISAEAEKLRANPQDLDDFYKSQLKHSLLKATSNRKPETILAVTQAASKLPNPAEVLDHQDGFGRTALIWAGIVRNAEVVGILANAGASVNKAMDDGTTALMFAASNSHNKDTVAKLIDRGAGINDYVSTYGGTALTHALNRQESEAKTAILKSLLEGLIKEKMDFEARGQKFELKGEIKKGDTTTSAQDLLNSYVANLGVTDEAQELKSLASRLTIQLEASEMKDAAPAAAAAPIPKQQYSIDALDLHVYEKPSASPAKSYAQKMVGESKDKYHEV